MLRKPNKHLIHKFYAYDIYKYYVLFLIRRLVSLTIFLLVIIIVYPNRYYFYFFLNFIQKCYEILPECISITTEKNIKIL